MNINQRVALAYGNYDLPRCLGPSETFHCSSEAEVIAVCEANKANIQEAHVHDNFTLVIYYKN
jgi:hypothetical protein